MSFDLEGLAVVTQKDVENVHSAFSVDPHRKMKELANRTEISYGCAYTILHKELELCKVAAKWITHVLTEENKKRRVEISRQLLLILDKGFLNIITGDKM